METVWSCGGHGTPKWLLENKTGSCSGPSFWEWAGKEGSLELELIWWAFCLMRTFCLSSGLFACKVGYLPVWWVICLCIRLLTLKFEIFATFYTAMSLPSKFEPLSFLKFEIAPSLSSYTAQNQWKLHVYLNAKLGPPPSNATASCVQACFASVLLCKILADP